LKKLEFGTRQGSHTKRELWVFFPKLHELCGGTVTAARRHIRTAIMVDYDM